MNRFTVDFSSSPVSEHLPSNSPQQQRRNIFSLPDQVASTTPAAPPPSQVFGSSQIGTGVSKIQFTKNSNAFPSSIPRFAPPQRNGSEPLGRPRGGLFEVSANTNGTEDDEQEYTNNMIDNDQEHDESADFQQIRNSAPSLLKFSTNSMHQSMRRSHTQRLAGPSRSRLPRKGRPDIVPGLAKDISQRLGLAALSETDEIVLGTEDLMRGFDDECQKSAEDASIQSIVTAVAQELVLQWKRRSKIRASSMGQNTIGPNAKSSSFDKAQYLSTILLTLRHPDNIPIEAGSLVFSESRGSNHLRPMPEVLLDWLDNYHINYQALFEQVMSTSPSPSANELYWDAIEMFTLRGKFEEVMELLRRGDLNYAVIDTPEGTKDAHFSGIQLQHAEDAMYRARQLINTCPALQSGDWNLDGQDWDVYRKQLEAEIEHLADQVTSHNDESSTDVGVFGKPTTNSGLPFMIYQRLKTVYSVMLGDANEIISLAQDWVEASMLLTVWWIPTEERGVAQWSFDVSRANDPKADDIDPYIRRLSESFLCVTDPDLESTFQLNTMDPLEVGLGSVLQGEMQSCLRILQSLSLCAASSVAEIGAWAGWLASATSAGLDQDDLMVLNYGSNDASVKKDDIMESYARALFDRDVLHSTDGEEVEGWELSFSIFSRFDDQKRMHTCISELLQNLPVNDQDRAAKLVGVCEQFGLETEGRKVSEDFADNLVKNTTEYGIALLCYARAHAEHKVRQLIDLLNSYCLVQSKAYPAESEMDQALVQLVSNPKAALQSIADADPQAAGILQFYLAGYACVRRFYSLRDDQTSKGMLRPMAKRKAAAKALVAAISSAADSIYGGLYDPDRQSAIQIDGLLTMLGEATAFLGQERPVLSVDQMFALLAAIEDLQTINDRVYRATEECMEAALRNYHGSQPPSPRAMLKKSVSSGTNSNFSFSMMGSEMLTRSEESLGGRSFGSAVMIGNSEQALQRGWDWRAPFKDPGTTGAQVLRHLRLAIATELSMKTVEEGN